MFEVIKLIVDSFVLDRRLLYIEKNIHIAVCTALKVRQSKDRRQT